MAVAKTNGIWDFLVLWPFIYFVVLMIVIPLVAIVGQAMDSDALAVLMAIGGFFMVLVHIATIVCIFVVYVYAIHRLYTQSGLPDDKKKMWLILIMIFSIFAVPFLHFMHLRRK